MLAAMKIPITSVALSTVLFLGSCVSVSSIEPFVALGSETGLSEWRHQNGRDAEWTDLGGGAMEVRAGTGNLFTREHFGDARIELDFMTLIMPNAKGQGRGNSGVYVQGLYEVQVLDSFGIEPGMDTCGAIYNVSVASASVCLAPGEWQHYAIEFSAPRFDDAGSMTSKPALSVWQNGVQIQDNVELDSPTGSASGTEAVEFGPLMLQDHGNPVRFRNVKILPR